jgi:hypothetical protein
LPDSDAGEDHLRLVLDFLGRELDPSILIGGWATVLRVGGDISYDIDMIITSPEVRGKVRSSLEGVSESNHLCGRKLRGDFEGVHVDVYLPHESRLGVSLGLRVEVLAAHAEPLESTRWQLLTIEAHTISKFAALLDWADTEKGFKDAREIARLLAQGVDAEKACEILVSATIVDLSYLPGRVTTVFDLLATHAGLVGRDRRTLHTWRRQWLDAIDVVASNVERARPPLA